MGSTSVLLECGKEPLGEILLCAGAKLPRGGRRCVHPLFTLGKAQLQQRAGHKKGAGQEEEEEGKGGEEEEEEEV